MPSFAHIVKDDIALFDHAEFIPRDGGYALVMNVVLLSYLKLLPKYTGETASGGV